MFKSPVKTSIDNALQQIQDIQSDIDELLAFNEALCKKNNKLEEENVSLRKDVRGLSDKVIELSNVIQKKTKLWKYLESRFVEVCKTCTNEEKAKCIMFPEYCEGECTELIDLVALMEKAADKGVVR